MASLSQEKTRENSTGEAEFEVCSSVVLPSLLLDALGTSGSPGTFDVFDAFEKLEYV